MQRPVGDYDAEPVAARGTQQHKLGSENIWKYHRDSGGGKIWKASRTLCSHLESQTNGFDSKRRPKQLPHQFAAARSPPHALLLRNAIDDGSARCPALAPTRAALEALDRRP